MEVEAGPWALAEHVVVTMLEVVRRVRCVGRVVLAEDHHPIQRHALVLQLVLELVFGVFLAQVREGLTLTPAAPR